MELNISEWKKKSLPDIEQLLKEIYPAMIDFEKKCDYINAEAYRSAYENGTQYLRERQLEETQNRHRR